MPIPEDLLSALWAETPLEPPPAPRPLVSTTTGVLPPVQLPHGARPGDVLVAGENGQLTWRSPREAFAVMCDLPDGVVLSRETVAAGFHVVTAPPTHGPVIVPDRMVLEMGFNGPTTNADVLRGIFGSGPPVVVPSRTAWDVLLDDED